MATIAQTKLFNFIFKIIFFLIAVLIITHLVTLFSTTAKSIVEALTPPKLPESQVVDSKGEWLPQYRPDQNWGGTRNQASDDTKRYHHISQGTRTLPIPYEWFIHLEQADSSLWSFFFKNLFFIKNKEFSNNHHLLRFGFIRSEADPVHNPDGLPIGFSRSPSTNLPGYKTKTEGIGFTCAACHTGHFTYGEGDQAKEYIIEGAPATTDLTLLTKAIAATLGQTALSSKIPFFDGRFDRFAKNVLGTQYNAESKLELSENLANIIESAQKTADIIEVEEGFTRLDALNRIGNQVFSKDLGARENYQPINAPVNYPHIWTASWFNWVQYDASIMSRLVRNAGEAMGVSAHVSMNVPKNENRFDSSIPFENLVWLEDFLAGNQPNEKEHFSGLLAPSWTLNPIDDKKANKGKILYQQRCQGCHLPALDDPEIWKKPYYSAIRYKEKGKQKQTKEKTLRLKIISEKQIGTDPAQGNVLAARTISTAGNSQGTITEITQGLGIDTTICGRNPNQVYNGDKSIDLVEVGVKDGGEISFGLALGALVQQTIDAWFEEKGITDTKLQEQMEGGRPNCIQAGLGYKARPLNGVWATAPFLHNGSVATLKHLLCSDKGERPTFLKLGKIDFDADDVGLKQPDNFGKEAKQYLDRNQLYTKDNYFILDTRISGNSNSGHYFSAAYDESKGYMDQEKGVIGPKFNPEQCEAVIEYLKTI